MPGTVQISVTPDSGTWVIDGPSGASMLSGTGDATYTGQPTGLYKVTWGALSGYLAPGSTDDILTDGGTITFTGDYVNTDTGIEPIVAQIVNLIKTDPNCSSYIVRDYLSDDLTVDQMLLGSVEVEYAPEFETEPLPFRQGLVKITNHFRIRMTKITNGSPSDARRGVEVMLRQVKAALSTTNGNLNGHPRIKKHSVRFDKARMDPVPSLNSEGAELNRRSITLVMSCVVFQEPDNRI